MLRFDVKPLDRDCAAGDTGLALHEVLTDKAVAMIARAFMRPNRIGRRCEADRINARRGMRRPQREYAP